MGLPSAVEALEVASKVCRLWGALATFSTLWLYIVARRARPGWQRLLAASPPLLGILSLVPCCFSRNGAEGVVAVCLSLLSGVTALKVAAFVLNRGPLADVPPGLWPFHTALHLIVTPLRERPPPPGGRRHSHAAPAEATSTPQLLLYGLANTAVWLGGTFLAVQGPPHIAVRHPALFFAMCGGLSAVLAVHAAAATGLVGMRVALAFRRPWFPPSLTDFWSRRWNVPTARLLKCLAFDPVMEGRLVAWETLPLQLQPTLQPKAAAALHGSDHSHPDAPGGVAPGRCVKDTTPSEAHFATQDSSAGGARPQSRQQARTPTVTLTVTCGPLRRCHGEGLKAAAPAPASAPPAAAVATLGGSPLAVSGQDAAGLPGGSKLRRALAVAASFALSGLFHELMLFYVSGAPNGLWFCFFILQAPLVLAEQEWLPPRGPHHTTGGLPRFFAAAAVMLLLQVVATFTWWPALEDSGLMAKMTAVAH